MIDKTDHTFTYITFVLLGCTSLLPWNGAITATQYFQTRFCETDFEETFESYFSINFTLAQLIGLAAQFYFVRYKSYQHSIMLPLSISCFLFFLVVFSISIPLNGTVYFIFIMVMLFALGFSTVILTSAIFAVSAQRTDLSQGAMVGQVNPL